jgi:hypothetical protein
MNPELLGEEGWCFCEACGVSGISVVSKEGLQHSIASHSLRQIVIDVDMQRNPICLAVIFLMKLISKLIFHPKVLLLVIPAKAGIQWLSRISQKTFILEEALCSGSEAEAHSWR